MRANIAVTVTGLGLLALSGCLATDPYQANAYRQGPTTTTTTTVVRDANGTPLSTTEAVRDANGNPVNYGPAYNAPGYSPPPYRRY